MDEDMDSLDLVRGRGSAKRSAATREVSLGVL